MKKASALLQRRRRSCKFVGLAPDEFVKKIARNVAQTIIVKIKQ
jgi:hypothetical protein